MKNKSKKIYSIQNSINSSDLVEIESIILNGLYRFSILGINQKQSSDTKDRVYSALRSQKLLNLKSENKKITINLLPTNIDKKDNFYDLGIALSCIIQSSKLEMKDDVLVVGELSITGGIIKCNYLLKTIYLAIENNIETIICPHDDLLFILKNTPKVISIIKSNKIKFFTSNDLDDLVSSIRKNVYTEVSGNINTSKKVLESKHLKINDENIFKIILAICTNRSVFIEEKNDSYLNRFIKNLIYYSNELNIKNILTISNNTNKKDAEVIEKLLYPTIYYIDSQTKKENLETGLKESIFGFNIINDFINVNDDVFHEVKTRKDSSILCFYKPCSCGNINTFFNATKNSQCLCLQRNILRYKQKLKCKENNFFDFYINNFINNDINLTEQDYMNINLIIEEFKKTKVDIIHKVSREDYTSQDKIELDEIFKLAEDVVKLNHILEGDKPVICTNTIALAITMLKKDF